MAEFSPDDIRSKCPPELLEIIRRPHEHEYPKIREPLWIIWVQITDHDGFVTAPAIDTVCDNEDSAICHVGMVFETYPDRNRCRVFVERIPANHRFGSSLVESGFIDAFMTQPLKATAYHRTEASKLYRRDGD